MSFASIVRRLRRLNAGVDAVRTPTDIAAWTEQATAELARLRACSEALSATLNGNPADRRAVAAALHLLRTVEPEAARTERLLATISSGRHEGAEPSA